MPFLRLLLGRILPNRRIEERKLTVITGIPAMGLDGLGSSAYGPEAALAILAPLGAAGISHIGPIMFVIVAVLAILSASYWQTIEAYPNNGGSYIVSRENLGRTASLVAAAALMIDYVLNVAVGISAGVGALVSAIPALHPYVVELCLGILALTTFVNLRGTLDAGRLFAIPTYAFVACFLGLIAVGVVRTLATGGAPEPVVAPPALPHATEAVSFWILLRAFSAGSTAMTGVESVSNGVGAFTEPRVKHAHRTLVAIVAILGVLLLGIGALARAYHIGAMDQSRAGYQSVLSQLAAAVAGRGVIYDVAIGSLLCVLALSANTSFVGFPRLCQMVAEHGFLPHPFAIVGRRLVFSVGIIYLALASGILIVAFGGITDRLIPLFAIGAFLTFTLSQSGMVVHWWRTRGRRWWMQFAINGVGAIVTGIALVVITATKFLHGAWITLVVIPLVVLLLRRIRRYYDRIDTLVRDDCPLRLTRREPPIIVVATESWNRLTDRAIAFALQISPDVYAVHVTALEGPESDCDADLQPKWEHDVTAPARAAGLRAPRLLVLHAEYRRMHEPILRLVRELENDFPERTIAVLLPELVKTRWWQYPLHEHRASRLRSRLLRDGGSRIVIVDMPWYLQEPDDTELTEDHAPA